MSSHNTTRPPSSTYRQRQACSAGAQPQPPLLRPEAIAMAIAAKFHARHKHSEPASRCTTRRCRLLDPRRPGGQRRLQPSTASTASCSRARPSVVLLDAPTCQRRAAHMAAAEAATARRRRSNTMEKKCVAINHSVKRLFLPSCQLAILFFEREADTRWACAARWLAAVGLRGSGFAAVALRR